MLVNMSLDGILSYLRRFWSKTRQRLGQYLGILFLYFVFVILFALSNITQETLQLH